MSVGVYAGAIVLHTRDNEGRSVSEGQRAWLHGVFLRPTVVPSLIVYRVLLNLEKEKVIALIQKYNKYIQKLLVGNSSESAPNHSQKIGTVIETAQIISTKWSQPQIIPSK